MLRTLARAHQRCASPAPQQLHPGAPARRGLLPNPLAAAGGRTTPGASGPWARQPKQQQQPAQLRPPGARPHRSLSSLTPAAAAVVSDVASQAQQASSSSGAPSSSGPTTAPTFQEAIRRLQDYWASVGCVVWLPHNTEVGAGTMNPATFLR
jgi:hypothetical protein